MSINRGMCKEDVVHAYSGIKRNETAICQDVDGPEDCHTD